MTSFRVVQVTNVAPTATRDQMKTLFSYIGKIEELKLYPNEESFILDSSSNRVCYVKYVDNADAGVACHLTNTVFIDRALIVVPAPDTQIPDEVTALKLGGPGGGSAPGMTNWPADVVNKVTGTGSSQMLMTFDPKLAAMDLPAYPALPATLDNSKIDDIRRTVYVQDIDPSVNQEELLTFFNQAGEIKYARMAGTDNSGNQNAFIEFSYQSSVPSALAFNGVLLKNGLVSVTHSMTAIVKPTNKSEAGSREVEEALKKVKEAQSLISAAVDPEYNTKRRSRSPRRRRSTSRSRHSRSRRSRSKSKSKQVKDKEQSRRRSHSRRRSTSRSRRRSRSRSRKRSKSPRRSRRSRSRSRGRRKKSRSRTPPRGYRGSRRSRSTSRDRDKKKRKSSPSPTKKRTSRSKSASPVKKADSESPARKKSTKARSPSRRKRSRSRSHTRTSAKTAAKRRSRSKSREKRSRSRSRHRKEKKRSRSRSKDRSSKKKRDKETKEGVVVKRDYDAEEKDDFSSDEDVKKRKKKKRSSSPSSPAAADIDDSKDNLQQMDMDMDSD